MASASDLFGGGDIPKSVAPSINTGAITASITTTDVTILSESSGVGGIFYGFNLHNTTSGQKITVFSIKITVDGGTQKTLTYQQALQFTGNVTGAFEFYVPLLIKYKTSLTVKINVTTGTGGGGGYGYSSHYCLNT